LAGFIKNMINMIYW